MHHIFVDENFIDISNSKITIEKDIDKENFNHLARVLRVKVGEQVLCSPVPFSFTFDYKGKVCDVTDDDILIDIIDKTKARELPVRINLYQGLPKSDKLEFIIEKVVELGAYSIIPVENEFSVAKMEGKKIVSKLERLNKISKSAAEQSKRNIIPEVKEPISFNDMISKIAESESILFYEDAMGIGKTKEYIENIKSKFENFKNKEDEVLVSNDSEINVIIGPEGGFSEKEIEKAREAGVEILSLGDRILRTETAAITALSILMYELQK